MTGHCISCGIESNFVHLCLLPTMNDNALYYAYIMPQSILTSLALVDRQRRRASDVVLFFRKYLLFAQIEVSKFD